MSRIEMLRRRGEVITLENFVADLTAEAAEVKGAGRGLDVLLVTYNRVGEGLLEPRTITGGMNLEVYSGKLMTTVAAFGEMPALLTNEQVIDFYTQVGDELAVRILRCDRPTYLVVYGGEMEKFKLALGLIDKLSFLARAVGKGGLVKFHLLSCNCDLAEKSRLAGEMYEQGRLASVIYNPAGVCGGLADLGTIAAGFLGGLE